MRIFHLTLQATATTITAAWQTDYLSTADVYWRVLGATEEEALHVATSRYDHVVELSGLLEGATYSVRVLATDAFGDYALSDEQRITTRATLDEAGDEGDAADDAPRCTRVGDALVLNLPSWLAMARIPGVMRLYAATTEGQPFLTPVVTTGQSSEDIRRIVETIHPGALCYALDDPSERYQLTGTPGTVAFTAENPAYSAIIKPAALPAGVYVGAEAVCADDVETRFTVARTPGRVACTATSIAGSTQLIVDTPPPFIEDGQTLWQATAPETTYTVAATPWEVALTGSYTPGSSIVRLSAAVPAYISAGSTLHRQAIDEILTVTGLPGYTSASAQITGVVDGYAVVSCPQGLPVALRVGDTCGPRGSEATYTVRAISPGDATITLEESSDTTALETWDFSTNTLTFTAAIVGGTGEESWICQAPVLTLSAAAPTSETSVWEIETGSLTLSDSVGAARSGATWSVGTTTLTLSGNTPQTSAGRWFGLQAVGRAMIEGTARTLAELRDEIALAAAPYSLDALPDTLAWYGHILYLRSGDERERLTAAVTRVADDFPNGVTLPALRRVGSAHALTRTPAPCYYDDGSLLVFHHLHLIEETCTVTDGTITTRYPLDTAHALYLYDDVYGWTAYMPDALGLDGGTTLTLPTTVTTSSVRIRYEYLGWQQETVSLTADDGQAFYTTNLALPAETRLAYVVGQAWYELAADRYTITRAEVGSRVTLAGTGWPTTMTVRYLATPRIAVGTTTYRPQPHAFWNEFDDRGALLGLPRLPHEGNAAYRDRLHAAADIAPQGTRPAARAWLALQCGTLVRALWDRVSDETFSVPSGTLDVLIPQTYQLASVADVPLLPDDPAAVGTTGTRRYYFPEPPVGDAYIFSDGRRYLTDVVTVDAGDGRLCAYVDLPSAVWRSAENITAAYTYRQWQFDADAGVVTWLAGGDLETCVVYCVQDISTTTFADPAFRYAGATPLIDVNGVATDKYHTYARQLLNLAPVTATQARWDLSLWFDRTLPYPHLSRLPAQWS